MHLFELGPTSITKGKGVQKKMDPIELWLIHRKWVHDDKFEVVNANYGIKAS